MAPLYDRGSPRAFLNRVSKKHQTPAHRKICAGGDEWDGDAAAVTQRNAGALNPCIVAHVNWKGRLASCRGVNP
ncbi:MAG: hypothetical protein ABI881_16735 [Betaproteobacteria bacterium]